MTTAIIKSNPYLPIINLVTNALDSDHSRRAYTRALTLFLEWHTTQGNPVLNKATVQAYRQHLLDADLSPATINQHLTAIKTLAREAADNSLLDPVLLSGIEKVKGVRREGQRVGNWLSREQAQRLLLAPDITTVKGLRDRALLAVMLGCGLRRSEVVALSFEHLQIRDDRPVIVDLVGKRGRVRSVPMPTWGRKAIKEYTEAVGLSAGRVFRPLNKWGQLTGEALSVQTVLDVVRGYTVALGYGNLAPHDLRRTFAKLARNGGAALDQIQASLGHASVETTQRYIGGNQSFSNAPADHLGIGL
jgi:site-specific recombinase XerD